MNLSYCRVSRREELEQILKLQQRNLLKSATPEIQKQEGFVSVEHDFSILSAMNKVCPHFIAKDGSLVIGYALCMHPQFQKEIELLRPMFEEIGTVVPSSSSFIVMGQICIDKNYRKKGVFRELYNTMKNFLKPEFDNILTSVDVKNIRSLDAHYAIGFTDLKTFRADNRNWKLIILR